jgi:hypothetical protein
MIGQCQRRIRSVRVVANHRDVFAIAHQREAESLKGRDDPAFRVIGRKRGHLNGDQRFGDDSVEDWRIGFEHLGTEDFNVEADRGGDVGEGGFIGVTLSHDGATKTEWIGDVRIGMRFGDDLS